MVLDWIKRITTAPSMEALIGRIKELEESKVPTGTKPLRLTVTDTIKVVKLGVPWISFTLINNGSDALTVWVNSEEDPLVESMIDNGETYNLDMTYPVIHTLYLKAESGGSATVRIIGLEGRAII